MKFNNSLQESYKRYHLTYKGTRDDYDIHDPQPYVVALDDNYDVDGNGRSILGVNINYYNGDLKKLINDINKNDNDAGFMGFEMVSKIKHKLSKNKNEVENWVISKRKERYNNFIKEFPYLGKFVRRYKISGPKGTGIQSKKLAIKKR